MRAVLAMLKNEERRVKMQLQAITLAVRALDASENAADVPAEPKRRERHLTAAQRHAISVRMKRYHAGRRKAERASE